MSGQRVARKKPVVGLLGGKSPGATVPCRVCLRSMLAKRRGQKAETCSLECRHLSSALRQLVEAVREDRAPGLAGEVREMLTEIIRRGFEEGRRLAG